jgi:transposase
MAKRNKYFKNKKVIKISLITDSNGIVLNLDVQSGNQHDSTILFNQLQKIDNKEIYKNSIFMADTGYDSKKLKIELDKIFKKTIIPFNPRNTKNPNKIKNMSDDDKKIYKNRIKVENMNQKIKAHRRLDVLYEKQIKNYIQMLNLSLLNIIVKELS